MDQAFCRHHLVRHVEEFLGYAIQPVRDIPSILILHGSGANGKTSLLRIMQALVDRHQVFSNQVALLGRDRFALAALPGRLLWIDDDVSDGVKIEDGLLKLIAEGKSIDARRAYGREPILFRSVALPVLAMNNHPKIADTSHGFTRRVYVVPFARRFKKDEMKPHLFDEIIEEELAGVLNRALAGLARLRVRGKFLEPADCLAAKESFLAGSNPLHGFISAACTSASTGKISIANMAAAFESWRISEGIKGVFPRNTMKRRFESMGFHIGKSHGASHVYGLKFREEWDKG